TGRRQLASMSALSFSVSTTSFHPPAVDKNASISSVDLFLNGERVTFFRTGVITAISSSARLSRRGRLVRCTSSARSARLGRLPLLKSIGVDSAVIAHYSIGCIIARDGGQGGVPLAIASLSGYDKHVNAQ